MYPAILDYDIVDAKNTKEVLTIRVKVILKEDTLKKEMWNFDIAEGKIQDWRGMSSVDIDSYTVFQVYPSKIINIFSFGMKCIRNMVN
ncbi:hypothetical protein AB9M62_42205 [Bacillales bacterium AN1005]